MKNLKEINTHIAVLNGNVISIIKKGLEFDGLKIEDEFLYNIPKENKDDLFAIFERYEENNRINIAEFESHQS